MPTPGGWHESQRAPPLARREGVASRLQAGLALHASLQFRTEAAVVEQSHLEVRQKSGRRIAGQRAQGVQHKSINREICLLLLGEGVDHLQHVKGLGQPVQVLPQRPEALQRLSLVHRVQVLALHHEEGSAHGRLNVAAQLALYATRAPGHRPHLASVGGEQGEKVVSLPNGVMPEDDGLRLVCLWRGGHGMNSKAYTS